MGNAEKPPSSIDPQVLADLEAVLKRITDGTPVDPATLRRIEERAVRAMEELRRTRGLYDDETVNGWLRESRDES